MPSTRGDVHEVSSNCTRLIFFSGKERRNLLSTAAHIYLRFISIGLFSSRVKSTLWHSSCHVFGRWLVSPHVTDFEQPFVFRARVPAVADERISSPVGRSIQENSTCSSSSTLYCQTSMNPMKVSLKVVSYICYFTDVKSIRWINHQLLW
jgi:hypothetical protein